MSIESIVASALNREYRSGKIVGDIERPQVMGQGLCRVAFGPEHVMHCAGVTNSQSIG
jgi:hypothetical protein